MEVDIYNKVLKPQLPVLFYVKARILWFDNSHNSILSGEDSIINISALFFDHKN